MISVLNWHVLQLGLEVQQYGINSLRKVKSVILALTYLKIRSKKKF